MPVRRESTMVDVGFDAIPYSASAADIERTQPLARASAEVSSDTRVPVDARHAATLPVLQPAAPESPSGRWRQIVDEDGDSAMLRMRLERLEAELQAARAERDELRVDLQAAEELLHRVEASIRKASGGEPSLDVEPVSTSRLVGTTAASRRLVMREGDLEVSYPLGPRTTVGRGDENDIQVETRFISRRHALICSTALETFIQDLGSTNGVYVNGRRVARQALRHGDQVLIGKTEFCFLETDQAS